MKRFEAQQLDEAQRESHATMLSTLETRMLAAVAEVASRQNAVDLSAKVRELQDQVDRLVSTQKSLEGKDVELQRATNALAAYRDELGRCFKLNRVPAVDAVENDIVRADLLAMRKAAGTDADDTDGTAAAGPQTVPCKTGEVVLRNEGKWKEIRDVASGAIFYATSDVCLTPFKPPKFKTQTPAPPSPTAPAPPTPAASSPERAAVTPRSAVESPRPGARQPDEPTAAKHDDALDKSVEQHESPGRSQNASARPPPSSEPETAAAAAVAEDETNAAPRARTPPQADPVAAAALAASPDSSELSFTPYSP